LLKLDELQYRRLPCTSDVPHLEKVRVGPDSRHAPNQLPIAPVANVCVWFRVAQTGRKFKALK